MPPSHPVRGLQFGSQGAAVIEIGCGAGSRFLASRDDVLEVEVSAVSAHTAQRTHASVVQAKTAGLPIGDACAAAVVSSCRLEHLADDTACRSLKEMARVLRPGGRMVHLFDLVTNGPFWRRAKRQAWHESICVATGYTGGPRCPDDCRKDRRHDQERYWRGRRFRDDAD